MKSERLGLTMIGATLVVIALMAATLLEFQRRDHSERIRTQGVALVGLLARMPIEALVPAAGRNGPLDLLATADVEPGFAYATVAGPDGQPLALSGDPAAVPAPETAPADPSSWYGNREFVGSDGRRYVEHRAPILDDGELAALVRIGFRAPARIPSPAELPLIAWLALPIFCLVPLFYYLIQREIRPLRAVSEDIRATVAESPSLEVELTASGEVGAFIEDFRRLMDGAKTRVNALEHERTEVLTHTKVLSYEKARIESVLQSMPQGVLVLDESGSVTYANEKVGPLLGFPGQEIVGKKPFEWSPYPELTAFLSRYDAASKRKNAGGVVEIETGSSEGARISATAYPLFSPRERLDILGTLVVLSDVTAEVLAKQARQDLIAQLSHELKTPLHVIGMYAEMMLDGADGADAFRIEAGNIINDEVERVTGLINNLLSISRIEMGSVKLDRHRTRLNDLLSDALSTIERSAKEKNLTLELEVPGDLSAVNVDKGLIRVAIDNLLTNAVKYNHEGGTIVLAAAESDHDIVVSVRDTGAGIPEEEQTRIFEKFYRTESAGASEAQGHGLGLSLCREIVQFHLGEVEVESTPGEGSEFRIVLKKTPTLLKEAV